MLTVETDNTTEGRFLENVLISTTPRWWAQEGESFETRSERLLLKAASAQISEQCVTSIQGDQCERECSKCQSKRVVPSTTQVREYMHLEL